MKRLVPLKAYLMKKIRNFSIKKEYKYARCAFIFQQAVYIYVTSGQRLLVDVFVHLKINIIFQIYIYRPQYSIQHYSIVKQNGLDDHLSGVLFCRSLFVLFLFGHGVLSVLLRFTVSGYPLWGLQTFLEMQFYIRSTVLQIPSLKVHGLL